MNSQLKKYGTQLLLKAADRLDHNMITGRDWPYTNEELARLQGAELLRESAQEIQRLRAALLAVADAARLSPYRESNQWDDSLAKLIAHNTEFLTHA